MKYRCRRMFSRETKAQISYRHEKNEDRRRQKLFPSFFRQQDCAPQEQENEPGFLAQRAQEKKDSGSQQKHPAARSFLAQAANRRRQTAKPKCGRQRIGSSG